MIRVLIIGGYGNFGSSIATALAGDKNIQLIIAGRDIKKAENFANSLNAKNKSEAVRLDINDDLEIQFAKINPNLVIHTSGPYQKQSYHVASACIKQGCNYADLADAREFVTNISALDEDAKKAGVLICGGASTVPCLTSSIIDKYILEFEKLEEVEYAIATAQLTNRGLATVEAVLSYAGKTFKTLINGKMQNVFGWQDLSLRKFWNLNNRFLGNCDIPDLEIFPMRYQGLKTIRFKAGLELKFLHIILFSLSWLVRLKIIKSLQPYAKILTKISFLFDKIGTNNSGFYMLMSGVGKDGKPKKINFEIIAKDGAGLYIPSTPAIIIAKKFADGKITKTGAGPCVDIITLDEYLEELSKLNIEWKVSQSGAGRSL